MEHIRVDHTHPIPVWIDDQVRDLQERVTKLERTLDLVCSISDIDPSYQYEAMYGGEDESVV